MSHGGVLESYGAVMSNQTREEYETSTSGLWAFSIGAFAGVVLVTAGLFQAIEGLSAVLTDDVFDSTHDYLFDLSLPGWGWIHLVIGLLMVVIGMCVLYGQTWARAAGIMIAVVSSVANFAFLPHYPLWSLLVIAIDVLVIWALSSLLLHT